MNALPATDDLDVLFSTPERIVLKLEEAAARLTIDRSTLSREYHAGNITGIKIGKRLVFTLADIDAYIAKGRAACPARAGETREPVVFRPRRQQGN